MLWCSNQLEPLLLRLVDNLQRPIGDLDRLFDGTHVVTQSEELEAYLRLNVATHQGFAGNLDVLDFKSLIKGCLPSHCRDRDALAMHALLLELFSSPDALVGEALLPVRAYLHAPSGEPRDGDRAFQLARRVAEVFDDYRLTAPELLDRWRRGELALQDTPEGRAERWQAELWSALHAEGGRFAQDRAETSIRWVDVTRPFDELPTLALPSTLHVFGVSYLPPGWRRLLGELAQKVELHVYQLAPCMEFIEDVPEAWRTPEMLFQFGEREGDRAEALQLTRDDPPALRLWGRVSRESARALQRLSLPLRSCFVDPLEGGASLLRQLQHDVLFREPERRPPHNALSLSADDSLLVLECPTIQREVEVVASEIWSMVIEDAEQKNDPPLRFNDIAVIVNRTDRQTYLARIQAVFNEAQQIPFSLLDLPPSSVSRYLEAVELLLRLPLGDFSRAELLALVTHPNIAYSGDPELRQRWCEQLVILRGADRETYANTYVERDLFNWSQGLRRLFLGAFMAAPSEPEDVVALDGEGYLPLEIPQDQLEEAATFGLLVRSLIADARFARSATLSLAEWCRFFIAALGYLEPRDGSDERLKVRCLDGLAELARTISGAPVGYRVFCEFVRIQLAEIEVVRGQHLVDGVCVSSMLPMRSTPFRAVFLVGFGEGKFPDPEPDNTLDLSHALGPRRAATKRERDAALFLETLLGARDRLVLSYVARDEQTGEPQSASTVIQHLLGILDRGYLRPDDGQTLRQSHPLRRYDPRYFPELFGVTGAARPLPNHIPEAHREAQVAALRAQLVERGGPLLQLVAEGDVGMLRQALDPEVWRLLASQLELPDVEARRRQLFKRFQRGEHVDVPLYALRRFLTSPLQGAAAFLLGLREDDVEDILAQEDETFELARFETVSLLRRVFVGAFLQAPDANMDAVTELYDEHVTRLERSGHHPTGVFAEAARERHLGALESWYGALERSELLSRGPFKRLKVGAGETREDVIETAPAVVLSVPLSGLRAPLEVHLHGTTEPLINDRSASLTFVHRDRVNPGDWLRGFLDHVILAASGRRPDLPHQAVVVQKSDKAQHLPVTRSLAPLSQRDAIDYLTCVVQDLFARTHDYLLPIEAVLGARLASPPRPVAPEVEVVTTRRQGSSDAYGPLRDLRPFSAPIDAEAIVDRRLGLLIELLRGDERSTETP